MYEMQKMSGDIEFNNLTYYFKSQNLAPLNFIGYSGLLNIYEEIKNGKISIKKAKEYQKKLKSNLNKTTNNITKSKIQRDISIKYIKNTGNLYNSRQNIIHLFNDYAKINLKLCIKQNMEQVNTDIKIGTIFMNFENNKTSEPHVSIFNLTDKLD